MNKAYRLVGRILITGIGALVAYWLSVSVRDILGFHSHMFVFLFIFYLLLAYLVLPFIARLGAKLFGKRGRATRYTTTVDGLPCDPVNVALVCTEEQLLSIFGQAEWQPADALSFKSSVKMAKSFLFSKPYPTAPFSNLYLAGRPQDYGFQLPIGDNPRKRHHVRFWGLPLEAGDAQSHEFSEWLSNTERSSELKLWAGAGTRDTGLGLTKFTWQISHAVDDDANEERDFIGAELTKTGLISDSRTFPPPAGLMFPLNQFITDGEIYAAKVEAPTASA